MVGELLLKQLQLGQWVLEKKRHCSGATLLGLHLHLVQCSGGVEGSCLLPSSVILSKEPDDYEHQDGDADDCQD